MEDPVTCSNNFPNCESGVNQVKVAPRWQCACAAVVEARADERKRICRVVEAAARAVIINPNLKAIDGFIAAGWLEMVDIIEDLP